MQFWIFVNVEEAMHSYIAQADDLVNQLKR